MNTSTTSTKGNCFQIYVVGITRIKKIAGILPVWVLQSIGDGGMYFFLLSYIDTHMDSR